MSDKRFHRQAVRVAQTSFSLPDPASTPSQIEPMGEELPEMGSPMPGLSLPLLQDPSAIRWEKLSLRERTRFINGWYWLALLAIIANVIAALTALSEGAIYKPTESWRCMVRDTIIELELRGASGYCCHHREAMRWGSMVTVIPIPVHLHPAAVLNPLMADHNLLASAL